MQIMVEGKVVASLDRNKKAKVSLPELDTLSTDQDLITLDILVEGIGRDNSGSKFDLKGLMSQDVYLNGRPLSTGLFWRAVSVILLLLYKSSQKSKCATLALSLVCLSDLLLTQNAGQL